MSELKDNMNIAAGKLLFGAELDPNVQQKDGVSLSKFESRLVHALRQKANRLPMWIGMGNPTKNHKHIMAMATKLFQIASEHGIEYFMEYGTLLGYVRHRGIIPWDYDMDIACLPDQFQKWVEVGKWYEENDPVWGFKYYDDPDYAVWGYCMYLKADPNVLCDINEYRVIEKDGVEYLECTVKDWNYPLYVKDDIYPVRPVNCLGFRTFIANKAEKVLGLVENILGQCTHTDEESPSQDYSLVITNDVKWFDYDPVPFVLSRLYNPHIETLVRWPVIDVPEARSITQGLRQYGERGVPFIVRKATALDLTSLKLQVPAQLIEEFEASNAKEVKHQVSVSGDSISSELALLGADDITLRLSKATPSTGFQQAGKNGGWTFLTSGRKMWQMVPFEDTEHLLDDDKKIKDVPIHELLYSKDHVLWGRFWQGYVEAGDFMYVPSGTNYRLQILSNSTSLENL